MKEDSGLSWGMVTSLAGTIALEEREGKEGRNGGDKNCHVVCWPRVTWETAKRRRHRECSELRAVVEGPESRQERRAEAIRRLSHCEEGVFLAELRRKGRGAGRPAGGFGKSDQQLLSGYRSEHL